jgi:glycosyltransferase involved in cell wall biosynthesis
VARGVADAVSFAGAVNQAALTKYLARAHLVLAPSSFEGFGIAVIEAMASGSLVLANDIEAHRELMQQNVNGVLVDFAEEERAVQSVVNALRLPMAQVAAVGERAREAVSRFAWDRVVDEVERVYQETVTGGARR